jgi:hypothetical protein
MANHYPSRFNIMRQKNVTVAEVMNDVPLNIRFSIPAKKNIRFSGIFFHDKWMNWVHLFERLMVVQLLDDRDKYAWHLPSSEFFFRKIHV